MMSKLGSGPRAVHEPMKTFSTVWGLTLDVGEGWYVR